MKKKELCETKWCRKPKAPHRRICQSCRIKKYKQAHPLRYAFSVLKNNAKRRGKEFSLTMEQFREFCEETGYMDSRGISASSLSIDRIDSSRGYTQDNIQVLTLSENSLKSNHDDCPF